MRYKLADNIARMASSAPLQSVLVSIKQLYGVTCLLGCLFLLLVLLYDVQPLRSTMKTGQHWAGAWHVICAFRLLPAIDCYSLCRAEASSAH